MSDTLRQTLHSGCAHVSVYDLQVEDKTAFGRWYSPGTFPLLPEEVSATMYAQAVETLTSAGPDSFEHYEVSNYARPGYRSRHNQKYWQCDATWGFGLGAASYIRGEGYQGQLLSGSTLTLLRALNAVVKATRLH